MTEVKFRLGKELFHQSPGNKCQISGHVKGPFPPQTLFVRVSSRNRAAGCVAKKTLQQIISELQENVLHHPIQGREKLQEASSIMLIRFISV